MKYCFLIFTNNSRINSAIVSLFMTLLVLIHTDNLNAQSVLIKALYGKQTITDYGWKKDGKNDFALEFKKNTKNDFFCSVKFNFGKYWYNYRFDPPNQQIFFNGRFRYFHAGINLGGDINISKRISFSPFISQGYCYKDYINLQPSNIIDAPWKIERYFVGLNGALQYKIGKKYFVSLETSCIVYPTDMFPNPTKLRPGGTGFIGMTNVGLSYKIFTSKKTALPSIKKNEYKNPEGFSNYINPVFISVSNGIIYMKRFGDDKNYLSWFQLGYIKGIKAGVHTGGFSKNLKYSGPVFNFELAKGYNSHNKNDTVKLYDFGKFQGNVSVAKNSKYTRYAIGVGRYKIFGKSKRNIFEYYFTAGFVQYILRGDVIEHYNQSNEIIHKDWMYIRIRDNYFGLLNSNLQLYLNKNFSFLIESSLDFSSLNPNRKINFSSPWGYNYLADPSGVYFHFNLGLVYNFGGRKK